MAEKSCSNNVSEMKHQTSWSNQKQKPDPAIHIQQATKAEWNQNTDAFVTSPDEVARKAYFAYVNQGSLPGHEVQHWLAAEAELIAERNQTRVHGFNNHA